MLQTQADTHMTCLERYLRMARERVQELRIRKGTVNTADLKSMRVLASKVTEDITDLLALLEEWPENEAR